MSQEALDRHPYGNIKLSSDFEDYLVCYLNRENRKGIFSNLKVENEIISIANLIRQNLIRHSKSICLKIRIKTKGGPGDDFHSSEHTTIVYIEDDKFLKLERNFKIDQLL